MITVTFIRNYDSRCKNLYYASRNRNAEGKFSITFMSIEDAAKYVVNAHPYIGICKDGLTKQERICLQRKVFGVARNLEKQVHKVVANQKKL